MSESKKPGRNTLRRRYAPGIWEDEDGSLHLSLPELLAYLHVQDTPENRERLTAEIKATIREQSPKAKIVERDTPEE